jgi:hypothetical protein
MLLDGNFVRYFGSVRERFPLVLIPALRIAAEHWNKDLREMAGNLLQTLGDNGSILSRTAEVNERVESIWGKISMEVSVPIIRR